MIDFESVSFKFVTMSFGAFLRAEFHLIGQRNVNRDQMDKSECIIVIEWSKNIQKIRILIEEINQF